MAINAQGKAQSSVVHLDSLLFASRLCSTLVYSADTSSDTYTYMHEYLYKYCIWFILFGIYFLRSCESQKLYMQIRIRIGICQAYARNVSLLRAYLRLLSVRLTASRPRLISLFVFCLAPLSFSSFSFCDSSTALTSCLDPLRAYICLLVLFNMQHIFIIQYAWVLWVLFLFLIPFLPLPFSMFYTLEMLQSCKLDKSLDFCFVCCSLKM